MEEGRSFKRTRPATKTCGVRNTLAPGRLPLTRDGTVYLLFISKSLQSRENFLPDIAQLSLLEMGPDLCRPVGFGTGEKSSLP